MDAKEILLLIKQNISVECDPCIFLDAGGNIIVRVSVKIKENTYKADVTFSDYDNSKLHVYDLCKTMNNLIQYGPEPCPECGKTELTCYRCFMHEPTPEGWNNITKIPEKDGIYRTLCLVGSMSPKLREFHGDWYKNGTWRSFDWSRVLAWK